jgi:hypothetical protein
VQADEKELVEPTKYLRTVCRVQSSVWRLPNYCVCPPPAPKAGGTHSPGGEGGGGSRFWKTPDIGLASYSIISLRLNTFPTKGFVGGVLFLTSCCLNWTIPAVRSFVAADVDLDGKVSVEEFDSMIEAAAALPRYIFPNKKTTKQ